MIDSIIGILAAVSLTPLDGIMIVVGTALIFSLYKALESKVFAPLLEHVEQRESLTSGAVFTASQMRQKSLALKARFDEAVFRARVAGNSKKSEAIASAKDRAANIIRQAENDAANALSAGRQEIAKQIATARNVAEVQARELANTLTSQVDSQLSRTAIILLALSAALTSIFSLTIPSAIAAAGHAAHSAPAFTDLKFYWINFILYVGIMTYILRKPLAKGWAARAARIKQSVMRSSDEVEAAERELNAIEALTKTLPQEEERIKKEIAEQGDAEAAEIISQAEQRAARIRQQATELIKGETRSAQSSFRQALVDRAVQIAKDRFGAGEFSAREELYQTAAITRAKQLVQH